MKYVIVVLIAAVIGVSANDADIIKELEAKAASYTSRAAQDASVPLRMFRDIGDPYYNADDKIFDALMGKWTVAYSIGSYSNVSYLSITGDRYDDNFGYSALGKHSYTSGGSGNIMSCLYSGHGYLASRHDYICLGLSALGSKYTSYYYINVSGGTLKGEYYIGTATEAVAKYNSGGAYPMLGYRTSLLSSTSSSSSTSSTSSLASSSSSSVPVGASSPDYYNILKGNKYTVAGTFGAHDFPGVDAAFDWAFTMPNGEVYQLQGEPSADSAFGWKRVTITPPEAAWYMVYLGSDMDGDGNTKFDWVLVDASGKSVYKLAGVSDTGTFLYSENIDIKTDFSPDRSSIYFNVSLLPGQHY